MVVEMTPCPEEWPDNSNFLAKYVSCHEEFFDCGAVELAQKLVGQYLYCHGSMIVVRILETEAYPEVDDAVYNAVFCKNEGNSQFKIKGGRIVACQRDGAALKFTFDRVHLYLTAGKMESGDVVLLRSCQPIEGHHLIERNQSMSIWWHKDSKKNILINPEKVSRGLQILSGWSRNPDLYEGSGYQLFLADPTEEMVVLCGTRNLEKVDVSLRDKFQEYRFALETHKPAYDYCNVHHITDGVFSVGSTLWALSLGEAGIPKIRRSEKQIKSCSVTKQATVGSRVNKSRIVVSLNRF